MPYALMWSSTVIFIGYPMSSAMEVVWLDVPPLLATDSDEPGATQPLGRPHCNGCAVGWC
jgi:hypothetical protein